MSTTPKSAEAPTVFKLIGNLGDIEIDLLTLTISAQDGALKIQRLRHELFDSVASAIREAEIRGLRTAVKIASDRYNMWRPLRSMKATNSADEANEIGQRIYDRIAELEREGG